MPAKSAKQYKFFQAILHSKDRDKDSKRKGIGGLKKSNKSKISKRVAREFIKNTSKKKRTMFSRGR